MRYHFIAYGKPALAYARDGIAEYRKRMNRFARVNESFLKPGKSALETAGTAFTIALDERGKALSTEQWAAFTSERERDGISEIAFLLGAADGHEAEVRQCANATWQLAPMTLNHELALLVLWEQVYRVSCLLAGHPYHRSG